ncbi:methionyl-tRNA formyltransferase [Zwartia vadi]|uniref:methionyl-tRNA formyltransferase n=1 Tax=Zwartia vadi TaxID=3058168 RepID=UPI0025B2B174|nr:methionyl-tRNA formyltransferase [Zwartia vadi]MDN3987351.1 methionyl-tRNA formyltransferase [Zwartia vadi]
MRVGFAGTPEFSKLALQAILNAGFQVPLVLTQPDRPSGRGLKLTPSAVKQLSIENKLPVIQPRSLRLDGKYPDDARAAQHALQEARLDVLVVAAYGLILPAWVLQTPRFGCLNIHASLLPRWRGAAPIQRAIEAGDDQTGVTIMQMDEGLDTGDMLLVESLPIASTDNASTLHDKLAEQGARLIVQALKALPSGTLTASAQPSEGVTYAAKLDKAEAALALNEPAALLARRIRAFNPAPGATLRLPGIAEPVKVWDAVALTNGQRVPTPDREGVAHILGVSADGIDIATGEGTLRLLELQRPGGKRQPAAAFISGWSAASL